MVKKVAAVTGSRRGIGLAIVKKLAEAGYSVILSGVTPVEKTIDLIKEFKDKGFDADYIKCDISKEADRVRFIRTIEDEYGRLDIHVNNAGVAPNVRMDILETTVESFERLMKINLEGTFFMCQLVANSMIKMKEKNLEGYTPRIINIASISSYTSSTNRGEYCISKAGISMVTKLFADKLAEYGIPVFEVRPGIIMTDMTAAVKEKYEKLIAEGITPIKRFGQPEDVANCVMAIANGYLDFCTGQVLNPDGGFHIRRL